MSSIEHNQQPVLSTMLSLDLTDLQLKFIFRLHGWNLPYCDCEVELASEKVMQFRQLLISSQVVTFPVEKERMHSTVLSRILRKHSTTRLTEISRKRLPCAVLEVEVG